MAYRRAVSLFSNCGAGDLGYKEAGFRFDVMAELDPRRLEVCLLNHPGAIGVPGDLCDTWPTVVELYRQRAGKFRPSLLAACPPCQGMSSAQSGRGRADDADAGSRDKRNLLVVVIARVAQELKPSIIVVENVPAFLSRLVRHPETDQPISAANLLISLLEKDYKVFPILTDLADFGVPQTRKRAFLTFVRKDVKGLRHLTSEQLTPYPRPTHAFDYGGSGPIKLEDALEAIRLPSLDAKSETTAASDIGNGLHTVPVWNSRQYEMVAAIPPNSGASAWENNKCPMCGDVEVEVNAAVCPLCGEVLLRPIVQEEDGTHRLVKGFRTSSYKRMSPNQPASTITTASGHVGSDNTIHPFETRILSTLECAFLQSFPENFNWGKALEKWGHTNIREMIGEAVPPKFTHLHGGVLRDLLTGKWTIIALPLSDTRCITAKKKLESSSKKPLVREAMLTLIVDSPINS